MTVTEIDEKVSRSELIGWMSHIGLLIDERAIEDHNRGK